MRNSRISRFYQLFQDTVPDADTVLESFGQRLQSLPVKISLDLANDFLPLFKKELSELPEDDLIAQISKVLVEASKIESSYVRARRVINEVRSKFMAQELKLISLENFEQGVQIILNEETLPEEFVFDGNLLYKTLIRTYCDMSLLQQGILFDGAEISVEELSKNFPALAEYARKEAFEKICINTFEHAPRDYEEFLHIEKVTEKHKFNHFSPVPLTPSQIAFGYCSKDALTPPKLPRYAQILDPIDGENCSVIDSFHTKRDLAINCELAGHPVKIMVELWVGMILTEKTL